MRAFYLHGAARLAVSDMRDDALQLATRLWADIPIRADDASSIKVLIDYS